MKIINLFSVPCGGKSTTAAYLFQFFKNRGFNCELITEYAKDLTYAGRSGDLQNQFYVSAKQYHRLKRVEQYGNVPFVITDSPLLLGLAYSKELFYYEELKKLLFKLHGEFENINIFIKRVKPYNPIGRNQTEEESDRLAGDIFSIFNHSENEHLWSDVINGGEQGQLDLANKLLDYFLEKGIK